MAGAGRFAEVLLWGLQLEIRRFWKLACEALDKGGSGSPPRRAKRRQRYVAPTLRGESADSDWNLQLPEERGKTRFINPQTTQMERRTSRLPRVRANM